jgi:hypothetical protein
LLNALANIPSHPRELAVPKLHLDVIVALGDSNNVRCLPVIFVVENYREVPFFQLRDDPVLNRFGISLYPLRLSADLRTGPLPMPDAIPREGLGLYRTARLKPRPFKTDL